MLRSRVLLCFLIAAAIGSACSSSTDHTSRQAAAGATPPPGGAVGPGGSAAEAPAGAPSSEGGAGASPDPFQVPITRPSGPPVETAPPNAKGQTPAFPEQTRAPGDPRGVAFDVRVVAAGFVNPWAVAFLPDGAKLVTERPGRLRLVGPDGAVSGPIGGVPAVLASGQGGLLDVAIDPAFANTSLVYLSYAEPRSGGSGTAVARGRLVRTAAGADLADVTVIWRMPETRDADFHFGARLVFGRDGNLFVTIGERGLGTGAGNARDPATTQGKVIRLRPDGTIPPDNPLVGRAGARGEIWSLGHRNPQAAALHPRTGELWIVEHGARGGDEVNLVRPGRDYGWPNVSYGIDYSGAPIGEGITSLAGVEQPVYYWDPVIAPSGATFYDADAFPTWRGSLFVGALGQRHLVRLTLSGERIIGEERLLVERAGRIRDVRVGPAGTLFVSDESKGEILELVPR
jgi:aldose sugar dehydrogenase